MIFYILITVMAYALVTAMFIFSERGAAVPPTAEGTPLDDVEAGWPLTRRDRDVLRRLERELSDAA